MTEVVKTKEEGDLKKTILSLLNELGGFDSFVKKGDVVLLKPNFNTSDPFPASTDMGFLSAVAELAYESGAKLVMIGDSSTMTMNTRKIMEKLGVYSLLETEPPSRIYAFEEGEWVKKEIPGGKFLKEVSLPDIIERPDKIIFLPCLKTHKYARFTGSLKLSVGFMKPSERVWLHLKGLQEKTAELNKMIKPDLVIMDARKCFITGGPSKGKLEEPGVIMASKSRVSIDIEGIKLIQSYKGNSLKDINPLELPQIKRAIEMGIDNEKN